VDAGGGSGVFVRPCGACWLVLAEGVEEDVVVGPVEDESSGEA
jgi:cytidine deaminase